jgi:hypothetical protein
MNPQGAVPALVLDDGRMLTQSTARFVTATNTHLVMSSSKCLPYFPAGMAPVAAMA